MEGLEVRYPGDEPDASSNPRMFARFDVAVEGDPDVLGRLGLDFEGMLDDLHGAVSDSLGEIFEAVYDDEMGVDVKIAETSIRVVESSIAETPTGLEDLSDLELAERLSINRHDPVANKELRRRVSRR